MRSIGLAFLGGGLTGNKMALAANGQIPSTRFVNHVEARNVLELISRKLLIMKTFLINMTTSLSLYALTLTCLSLLLLSELFSSLGRRYCKGTRVRFCSLEATFEARLINCANEKNARLVSDCTCDGLDVLSIGGINK